MQRCYALEFLKNMLRPWSDSYLKMISISFNLLKSLYFAIIGKIRNILTDLGELSSILHYKSVHPCLYLHVPWVFRWYDHAKMVQIALNSMIFHFSAFLSRIRCSYLLGSAQNFLIVLKIGQLGSPNSKMGCYIKIGPFLAEKWRKDGDRK